MSIKDGVVDIADPPAAGDASPGAGAVAGAPKVTVKVTSSGASSAGAKALQGAFPTFDDRWGLTGGNVEPPTSIPPQPTPAAPQGALRSAP